MKIAIVCAPGEDSFTSQLTKTFRAKHEVRHFNQFDLGVRDWADLIWVEWADSANAVMASHGSSKPVLVRMHRYEAYSPHLPRINWPDVALVCSSPQVLAIAQRRCPAVMKARRVWTLPIGIDLDDFPLQPHKHGFRIGVMGNINARKNPFGWLQVLAAAREKDTRYSLHIAGEPQDECLLDYTKHMIDAMGLKDSVTFYGQLRRDAVASFWVYMDYCLSASLHDSYVVNVREAMACGVKPLVHEHAGARHQFSGAQATWRTVNEAVSMMDRSTSYRPDFYRQWVADVCSAQGQEAQLLTIVEEAVKA